MQLFTTILSIIIVTLMLTSESMGNRRTPLRNGEVELSCYEQPEFAGTPTVFVVPARGCINVPTKINDKISSISFGINKQLNCVFAYRNPNCDGTRNMLTDGTLCLNNLATPPCEFDKTISSFKACETKDLREIERNGK